MSVANGKVSQLAAELSRRLATDKRYKILEAVMRRYDYRSHGLIEVLHAAQDSFGYLDEPTLYHIAAKLHLPLSKVLGVATFYNYFTLKPQGKHTCVVCLGTACYIKGGDRIVEAVQQRYHVKPGATTPDGELSLLIVRCVGSCSAAPVALFDGVLGTHLDADTALQRVAAMLREGLPEQSNGKTPVQEVER